MHPDPPIDLRQSWRDRIHSDGMRVTPQREALLAAVWRLRHATAESLQAELAGTDDAVNLSTVYRGLDALERIGLVRHTHLGTGSPTYHISAESPHIHLQCNTCGEVMSIPAADAGSFLEQIEAATGFVADITHAAIYGTCADCLFADRGRTGED